MKLLILSVGLSFIQRSVYSSGGDDHTWDYESGSLGPSHWSDHYEQCGVDRQSPILLPAKEFSEKDNKCKTPLEWSVDDTSYNWTVTHNTHSIVFKSSNAMVPSIHLNNSFPWPSENNNDLHSAYIMDSFHFHWGKNKKEGSEHEFDDSKTPTTLEVHFVHYSNEYSSVGDALTGWEDLSKNGTSDKRDSFTLAVVGVLFEEVDDNSNKVDEESDNIVLSLANSSSMVALWNNVSLTVDDLSFAITDLVDVDDFMDNYYFYWGSLTTPPCTPAVRWHVAQNTIKIKKSTMDLFRERAALWESDSDEFDADENFRPLQKNNPSCVYSCSSGDNKDTRICPKDDDDAAIGKELLPLWIVLGISFAVVMMPL